MRNDPNIAFTLHIKLLGKGPRITITAFDDLTPDHRGAYRLTCEVKEGRRVIFPRGQLVCTCAPGWTTDGNQARELVMSLVAMAPDAGSGVDDDYWTDYTPEQLEWVNAYYEELDIARMCRYCDSETGEVRS